jgi:hypothetical protein
MQSPIREFNNAHAKNKNVYIVNDAIRKG